MVFLWQHKLMKVITLRKDHAGCPFVYVFFHWLMNKAILANGLAEQNQAGNLN